jgi:hypothetical protein
MAVKRLAKTTQYPQPHNDTFSWAHGLETATNDRATILPIIMYDEGLGAPSGRQTHPEHSSFSEVSYPNCFVDSRINRAYVELRFTLTKGALETDKIHALNIAFMPIFTAFKEDYTAIDEKSQWEVQDILELQTEDTDRQGYPLYNGVDMTEKYSGSCDLDAAVPGLTTDQGLEGVTFDVTQYYDALQFTTIAGKLKGAQGGLKWITLTRQKPTVKIRIRMRSAVKRMNPYSFFGVMTYVPQVDTDYQIPASGDVTNISHVYVDAKFRYNEWNENFSHNKV